VRWFYVHLQRHPCSRSPFSVYTGYVDVEAKHFFFWFFESRRNPDEDDVMLWLNGGASDLTRLP
jgi:hypothetical protein